MLHEDVYIAEKLMEQCVGERRRRAESRYLARQLKRSEPGWLVHQARVLACALGLRMVAVGSWLERYAVPHHP